MLWVIARQVVSWTDFENPLLQGEKMSKGEALKGLSDDLWAVWLISSRTFILIFFFQLLTIVLVCAAQHSTNGHHSPENAWATALSPPAETHGSLKKLARFHCVAVLFQPRLDLTTIYVPRWPPGVSAESTGQGLRPPWDCPYLRCLPPGQPILVVWVTGYKFRATYNHLRFDNSLEWLTKLSTYITVLL